MEIKNVIEKCLELEMSLKDIKSRQKEIKTQIDNYKIEIKEYLIDNEIDKLALSNGEIKLVDRKISQTFKKETIANVLQERLKQTKDPEELADSIIENKKYIIEKTVKINLKKS